MSMKTLIIITLLAVLGLRNVGPVAWGLGKYDAGLKYVWEKIIVLYKKIFRKQ